MSASVDTTPIPCLVALLKGNTIKDVEPAARKNITTVRSDAKIKDVIALLSEKRILSVPVLDAQTGLCTCMVDMLDVVVHVISQSPKPTSEAHKAILDPWSVKENEVRDLTIAGRAMGDELISHVAGRTSPWAVALTEEGVADDGVVGAIRYLASGVRRIPILSERGDAVVGLLTQSDVCRYVHRHMDKNDGELRAALAAITVKNFPSVHRPLVCVTGDVKLLNCLEHMHKKHVNAVPVVDDDGKLLGNFSATDLKVIFSEKVPSLFRTCRDYLAQHAPASLDVCTVTATDTFADVLDKLVTHKIHRVWEVGADGKPLRCISMSDVMVALVTRGGLSE